MSAPLVHRESFRVRCYETDPTGRLTLPSLLDLFQEAAWNHASHLGLSVPDLRSRGLTWVLFRLHVEVERYPAWGDTVTMETWPSGIHGLRFFRDFRVLDGSGGVLALGTTAYMVLDLERRRPVKLQDERVKLPFQGERALDDPFDRLPDPPLGAPARSFPVLRGDVDMNRHVNTTAYVRWCLECVDNGPEPGRVPVSLAIHYREECFLGDTILGHAQAKSDDNGVVHHGLERDLATPLLAAVAVSRWKPEHGSA